MKAAVYTRYGPPDVLQVRDVPSPVVGEGDVLVRVRASSVTSGDVKTRGFKNIPAAFWLPARLHFGLLRPKRTVPGSEFAGEVVACGPAVRRLKPGDRVFGFHPSGANAQYLALPEHGVIAPLPEGLTCEEAAAIPFGGLNALFFLRAGLARAGHRVLIVGASGAVGTAAVQIARHFGAEVTGVCSTRNLELVRSLGADRVIDYTREDVASGGRTYDLILDTVGATSFRQVRESLRRGGRYVPVVFGLTEVLHALRTAFLGSTRVICAVAPDRAEDLQYIRNIVEAGKLRPVIDRRYPLEEIAEAHRYVEGGHKRGAVVVSVEHDSAGAARGA